MPFEQSAASRTTAAQLMTPNPRTCSPYSTVLEAVMIFRDADCGAVPVVQDGKALGILTDRDVALALATYPDLVARPVSEIMTKGVVSVTPDTSLDEIQARFADEAVRRLLVLDASGQLLGIIAWADIARRLPDYAVGRVVSEVVTG